MVKNIGQLIVARLTEFANTLMNSNGSADLLDSLEKTPVCYISTELKPNWNIPQVITNHSEYVDACRRENATIRESYGPILITYIRRPKKLTLPARKMSNDELVAYYRGNFQNTPIGCVVALKIDGEVHLGWSLCHVANPNNTKKKKKQKKGQKVNKYNRFNKVVCLNKALNRALSYGGDLHLDVPTTVVPYINRMQERAAKYFYKTA